MDPTEPRCCESADRRELADELGVDRDFSFEKLGDWAAGFGGFDRGVEFGFVGSGDGGGEIEMALGNGESVANFFKRDGGGGFEFLRGDACAAELRGKRHGKATSVCSGEKFLGIGADAIFKARVERVGRLFED